MDTQQLQAGQLTNNKNATVQHSAEIRNMVGKLVAIAT